MTIKIPGQVGWKQINRGEAVGSLWSTFNIDLQSNLSKVRVSPRLKLNSTQFTSFSSRYPVAFERFGTRLYSIVGTTIYRNTNDSALPSDAFAADTSTSAATDYTAQSDLLSVWGVLLATSDQEMRSLSAANGGTWTDRITGMTSSSLHKMCYFKKYDRVYVTDVGIESINSSYTHLTDGDYTLPADSYRNFSDIKATSNSVWIATKTKQASNFRGSVLQWDGISNQVSREYKLPCTAVLAIAIDEARDVPIAIGNDGVIYEFTGSGFTEAGRFPFKNRLPYIGSSAYGSDPSPFIHPNGVLFTKNGTLLMLINGQNEDSNATQEENLPSGVWELSRDGSLVHKYSISYDPVSSAITDYGQSEIINAGALFYADFNSTSTSKDGTLLVGASYYTSATATASSIFYDNSLDTVQKYGYIVTPQIFSDIVGTFSRIITRFKRFLDSGDRIDIKYRTDNPEPERITITWTSTNTFTTTSDIDTKTGYEVEIIRGTGAGKCAHITSIVNNAGTRTVTLDDTFTGVTTGTAIARLQNWQKVDTVSSRGPQYSLTGLKVTNPWIQFKICMQFKGRDELHDIIIDSVESIDRIR
jgi:hypothetical protein